jgi:hypothetical protein
MWTANQWPRGVRKILFSIARTLEQWIRIPVELWMEILHFSVIVSSYVISYLAAGAIP